MKPARRSARRRSLPSMSRPAPRAVTVVLAAASLIALPRSRAYSQVIDYQRMEQLFGEPVTSSATGKPQRASDAPANMEIITQDDIRRSGATSIPDALQFVTGVEVRSYGIADAEVGIRGYNQSYNPRLLVLVNGRQVYSDNYGHVSWPTIPVQLDEIRQIEVIKGPNSALYGFNAVGGVINIITYDPLHDKVNAATLRGGTQNYFAGSVVGTGRIGADVGVRMSAGGFHATDFGSGDLALADAGSRDLSPDVGNVSVAATARVAAGVETFVEASMGDSRYAEKGFADTFDTTFTRTNSVRAGVNADTAIGLISVDAYRNEERDSIGQTTLTDVAPWSNQDVYVVRASDVVKFGSDHTVRVGLEYRNNSQTAPGYVQGTIGYDVYAASLMWDWAITPRLSWTNAVRVDDLNMRYSGILAAGTGITNADYAHENFAVPSYNSGLVFNVTDLDTLRLLVARGVQVPSLLDFGLQFSEGKVGPVVVAGNPNLHPSTVDNVEMDYDRSLPSIGSTVRTALFAERTRDIISEPFATRPFVGSLGVPVFLAGNVGGSDAVGAEIGLKGHSASGLRWNASYAFVTTTDGTVQNATSTSIDYAHAVPRHVVTAGIGDTWERVEIDLMGRWQSSYRDFQFNGNAADLVPIEIRNFLTLTAHISYRLTDNVTLALTAQQFNTSRLLQAAGPPLDRRFFVSATAHF